MGAGWGGTPIMEEPGMTIPSHSAPTLCSCLGTQGSRAVPGAGVWHCEPRGTRCCRQWNTLLGPGWLPQLYTWPGTAAGACLVARLGTRRASQGRRRGATTGMAAGQLWGSHGQCWGCTCLGGGCRSGKRRPQGRDGAAVPVSGRAQASPQPEKQHLWFPGQSRSSTQWLEQVAALLRARFRGQKPGLAGEGAGLGLGVEPILHHSTRIAPTERGEGADTWHHEPITGTPGCLTWLGRYAAGAAAADAALLPRAAHGVVAAAHPAAGPSDAARAGAVARILCGGRCSVWPDARRGHRPPPASHPSPIALSRDGTSRGSRRYLWWGGGRS